MFKRFFIHNLILALLISIGSALVFGLIYPENFTFLLPFLILVSLAINLIGYRNAQRDVQVKSRVMLLLVKSFALRFFVYIGFVGLLLFFEKDSTLRIFFVVTLFIVYVSFTSLEIKGILALLKPEETESPV